VAVNTPHGVDSSRERVRRAAVTLFATRGFHGTGIRDLAQAAGLSSASLYHYMGTKEDLLAGIMRDALGRLVAAAREVTGNAGEPGQRLSRLVALHVLTHAVRPDETRVVDNEVRALSTRTRQPVIELRDAYERIWAEVIEQGVANQAFHTPHPTATRLALLEMCNGVARWYSPRGELTLDALAGHHARLALRVVGCPDPAPEEFPECHRVVSRFWDVGHICGRGGIPCPPSHTEGPSKSD
jgi:AcrR family transcriptional regulator